MPETDRANKKSVADGDKISASESVSNIDDSRLIGANGISDTGDDSSRELGDPTKSRDIQTSLSRLELAGKGFDGSRIGVTELEFEKIDMSAEDETWKTDVLIGGGGITIQLTASNSYFSKGKFLRPVKIESWVVVVLFNGIVANDREKDSAAFDKMIKTFTQSYVGYGRRKGISIEDPQEVIFVPSLPSFTNRIETMNPEKLKSELRELFASLNDRPTRHALVIAPKIPTWIKAYIQYLETKKWTSIERPSPGYRMRVSIMYYNELLQINQDNAPVPPLWRCINYLLGGVNIAVKQTSETTDSPQYVNDGYLILSIDKCALVPTEFSGPAFDGLDIAASLGMWNLARNKMKFRTQATVQANANAISRIDRLVLDSILSFKKRKNGQLPTNIIIFRAVTFHNEVSHQRQSSEIAQQELASIRRMRATHRKHLQESLPLLTYLIIPKVNEQTTKNSQSLSASNIIKSGRLRDLAKSDGVPTPHVSDERSRSYAVKIPSPQHTAVFKLYDESNFTSASIRTMIRSMNYLSPRFRKSWSSMIDLAYHASNRARRVSAGWLEDNRDNYNGDQERMIKDLSGYLEKEMGDENYRNTLFCP